MRGKNNRRQKNKKTSGVKNSLKFISIVLTILLIYVIGMGVWFGFYMKSKIDYNKQLVAEEQNQPGEAELALDKALEEAGENLKEAARSPHDRAEDQLAEANILGNIPDKTFFAVYGVDQDEKLTDVIIVACFDKNTRKITALSIPRDTYVTLSDDLYMEMRSEGHSAPRTMKINAVHSWGEEDGNKYITEELEEMLGIPQISFFITVNVEAFQKIVDDIGGITIDVPQDMYYNDAQQGLYINLKQGVQTLDGYNAMCLVRYRHYTNGDVDRVQVQQLFLNTLLEKALSTETILKNINNYVETFLTYVQTNMTVTDALKYTPFFPVLKADSLVMATLPGGLRAGDSGYFINSDYTEKLVDILFYDGDGDPAAYSGLSWGNATSDSAEAVTTHSEREIDEADNGNAIEASIDYEELARLKDKDQFAKKLADIAADYPEPSDESKEVIARYIEFASSAYCQSAFYSGGENTAEINAENLGSLNKDVLEFSGEMNNSIREKGINLLRDLLPTARVDVSSFDYDNPINIKISKDVLPALEGMDRLTVLVGDNLHQVQLRKADLEKILDEYDGFTITFYEGLRDYTISFSDERGREIDRLPAPVYFGFYSDYESTSCYFSKDESVENIGGSYDEDNKCLLFSAVEGGTYTIQDIDSAYAALSDLGEAKKQRITDFLNKGFVPTAELDMESGMNTGDFLNSLDSMLKEDSRALLGSLGLDESQNLKNGELLAACGTLLNHFNKSYYPSNKEYYLGLWNIYDNKDEYDGAVALAISSDLMSFRGDSFKCSEDAVQRDILNVLSNTYNLISPVAVAEYNFVQTEAPPEPEPVIPTDFTLDEDTVFMLIILSIFVLAALLILVALIAVLVKARKEKKKAEAAEAQRVGAEKSGYDGYKEYEEYDEYDEYEDDEDDGYDDDEYDDYDDYDDDEEYYDDEDYDEYDDDYDDDEEYGDDEDEPEDDEDGEDGKDEKEGEDK